ncbi:hypothetical protein [Emergencia timonensis]
MWGVLLLNARMSCFGF